MNDDQIKRIPINELRQEEGVHEPATSPDMEPYLRLIMAGMQDHDTAPFMEEIRQLPLEKRYSWRVASAMKWEFADFENVYVEVDRDTLSEEDFKKLFELVQYRPVQLCMFLAALLGAEEMKRMMLRAIVQGQHAG